MTSFASAILAIVASVLLGSPKGDTDDRIKTFETKLAQLVDLSRTASGPRDIFDQVAIEEKWKEVSAETLEFKDYNNYRIARAKAVMANPLFRGQISEETIRVHGPYLDRAWVRPDWFAHLMQVLVWGTVAFFAGMLASIVAMFVIPRSWSWLLDRINEISRAITGRRHE